MSPTWGALGPAVGGNDADVIWAAEDIGVGAGALAGCTVTGAAEGVPPMAMILTRASGAKLPDGNCSRYARYSATLLLFLIESQNANSAGEAGATVPAV